MEKNSISDFLDDGLSVQLGDCLLHEDSHIFQAAIEYCLEDEAANNLRPLWPLMFNSLPKSSNDFSFQAIALPKRNDPCVCGSGKKLKKCCPQILDFPLPKAQDLFSVALTGLSEDGFDALAEKPNWNLPAITVFFQHALERDFLAETMTLLLPLLRDLSGFRNEHQDLLSCMLDILFELGEDDLRIQLIQDMIPLKQAPALQSIAHQRFAMIFAQLDDTEKTQYHLQQALRSDPNQEELPMAELSILGVIASEEEIKARAKFWQVKLKKKYDTHPVLDFIEEILIQGKALFSHYREDYEGELDFDDDFENSLGSDSETDLKIQIELDKLSAFAESDEYKKMAAIEESHANSLISLLSSSNMNNNYDIVKIGDEAKLVLGKSLKPLYKQWLALYDEAGKEVNEIYAEDGEVMDDDDIDYHRWAMLEPDWLDFLHQYPMLMNNFEVLLRLSAHIYQAPTPVEEDEMFENGLCDEDLTAVSYGRQLISIYKQKLAMLVNNMIKILPENLYLPRRFKGNDCFWQLADEYEIELHEYYALEQQEELLQQLQALEKKPNQRIQSSLMLNYFQQGKLSQLLELYGSLSKSNLAMILMAACAYQHQGNNQRATELLASIKGKNKLTLQAFNQAIKTHSISPLFVGDIEFGIIPLCNQLIAGREEGSKNDRFISQSYLWLKGRGISKQ